MTQCSYIYASGLRIKEGDGCVIVDGKRLRVVRDGNGKSRLDLENHGNLLIDHTDGEISLRDLRTVLAERGEASTTIEVSAETPEGSHLRFYVSLDPSKAMGRQGREGDFKRTLTWLSPNQAFAENVSRYQLMTLPDSDKQAGRETAERLRLAVTILGVDRAQSHLDGRFGLLADQALLDETLAYITSEKYSDDQRAAARQYAVYENGGSVRDNDNQNATGGIWMPSPLLQEAGEAVVRVTGQAISDPSRVSDEHFKLAADWVLSHETNGATKLEFVDNTFDRLDDDSLRETLYQGLKDKDTRAEYTVMITDPDRLQRIKDWNPDVNPNMSIVRELRNMTTLDSAHRQARFLGEVARDLGVQFLSPAGQEFYRRSTETPLDIVRSLFKRSK